MSRLGLGGNVKSPLPGLNILLLEVDPWDAGLVTLALQLIAPGCTVRRANSRAALMRALDDFKADVILSDRTITDLSALEAFWILQSRLPGAPFLLVAGAFEQTISDCLKAGAADFIRKVNLARLGPAIERAMTLRQPFRRLTARQREVLQLLASGMTMRDIAWRLRVSVKTVETFRAQVTERTGIHGLARLVRYVVRVGVVSACREGERQNGINS